MNFSQEVEEEAVVKYLHDTISRGRFHKAYRVGREYLKGRERHKTSVDVAFATILAARLSGYPAGPILYRLEEFRGYNDTVKGDNYRDSAIQLIRKGDLDTARTLLKVARELHQGDEDRKAALLMAEAQLELATGTDEGARRAQSLHNHAHAVWEGLQKQELPFTAQWILNNRFHYIRSMTAVGYAAPSELRTLLQTEPRLDRRLRARMMHMLGKFGYRIDNRLFHGK